METAQRQLKFINDKSTAKDQVRAIILTSYRYCPLIRECNTECKHECQCPYAGFLPRQLAISPSPFVEELLREMF